MKKSLLKTLVLVTTALTLVGCGEPSKKDELKPESLYEALTLITTTKNYTIDRIRNNLVVASYVFTEKSIGAFNEKLLDTTDFYVVSGEGLYEVNFQGKYIKSEYILDGNGNYIKDLWNNDVVSNLYGINVNDICSDVTATEVNIKNRDFKLNFMQAVGFDSLDYLEIESIVASYVDNKLNIKLTRFDELAPYYYQVRDYGISKNKVADSYVSKNSGALVLGKELSNVRRLIKGNNFTLDSYDILEEKFYGQEWLTEDYWFSTYLMYGYFAARHKADPTQEDDADVTGTYAFAIENGQVNIYSALVSPMTDITEFEHYPCRAKLWNKMHYIVEGDYDNCDGKYTFKGSKHYYFDNQILVNDMLEMYSLDKEHASQDSIFKLANPKAIFIDYIPDTRPGDFNKDPYTKITFVYNFEYKGKDYYMPLPMYNFGITGIEVFDNFLANFNNY